MLIPLTESASNEQVFSLNLLKIANMLVKRDSIPKFLWDLGMSVGAGESMVALFFDWQLSVCSCVNCKQFEKTVDMIRMVRRIAVSILIVKMILYPQVLVCFGNAGVV